MRLIAKILGSSIKVVLPEDLMPEYGISLLNLVHTIAATYRFINFPTNNIPEIYSNAGIAINFISGTHEVNGKTIAISRIDIMHDSIVVSTQSTDDSDVVLEHLFEVLHSSLGCKKIDINRENILHYSHVVFELDNSIESSIAVLKNLQGIVTDSYQSSDSIEADTHLLRITFGIDPLNAKLRLPIAAPVPAEFVIERRGSSPLEQNRYFSSAPLSTSKHIETLEKIEKAMKS